MCKVEPSLPSLTFDQLNTAELFENNLLLPSIFIVSFNPVLIFPAKNGTKLFLLLTSIFKSLIVILYSPSLHTLTT